MQALDIRVYGKVQGVFFRANTQKRARQWGLTGRVRNESDGSVHIQVQGKSEALEAFVAWCRIGDAPAVVSRCEVEEIAPFSEEDFLIVR
ncbi:acylphosphatase [Cytophagales bacterium LB-30]|uniref:acylphosphatase n=1 Tax=Shiella aurantiaca TaxID=3058365 RepID=A0ABT8F5W4_9BACT|nr:acylphosphatase [Shiella aurantiaca]MDN4165693.1 acylphosphatase [Shiella aurantiaca]